MEFGGQASQTAAPVSDLYVPAAHSVHDMPSIRFSGDGSSFGRKGSSFSRNGITLGSIVVCKQADITVAIIAIYNVFVRAYVCLYMYIYIYIIKNMYVHICRERER